MSDISKNDVTKNSGALTCNPAILASIITLATKEVEGVVRISKASCKEKFKKIFNKNHFNGVQIKFNSNGSLVINVYVDIFFGVSVPEVAFRVQESIKSGIASMIEVKAARINVHVMNVIVQKEEQKIELGDKK